MDGVEESEKVIRFECANGNIFLVKMRNEDVDKYADEEIFQKLLKRPDPHNGMDFVLPLNLEDVMEPSADVRNLDALSPPRKKMDCKLTPVKSGGSSNLSARVPELAQQLESCSPFKPCKLSFVDGEDMLRYPGLEGIEELDLSTADSTYCETTLVKDYEVQPNLEKCVMVASSNLSSAVDNEVPLDKPFMVVTQKLKVEFLPKCIDIEYFRYWLDQKIAALSTDEKRFSVVAVQYDPASDSAVIEYNSTEAATAALGAGLKFGGKELKFHQILEDLVQEELSCTVIVSGFNTPIFKNHFLNILKEHALGVGISSEAFQCDTFSKEDTSVTVVFKDIHSATTFTQYAEIFPMVYHEKGLECIQLRAEIPSDIVPGSLGDNQDTTAAVEKNSMAATKKVKVESLPQNIDIEYFEYWLNGKTAALSTTEGKKFSVVGLQYDPATDTAVVEYNSTEAAAATVAAGLRFESIQLSLEQISEVLEEKLSCTVIISGFNGPIFKNHFLSILKQQSIDAGVACAYECDTFSKYDKTVSVTFENVSAASMFTNYCMIMPLLYNEGTLLCEQLPSKVVNNFLENVKHSTTLGSDQEGDIFGCPNEFKTSTPLDSHPSPEEDDPDYITESEESDCDINEEKPNYLKGPAATTTFLGVCMKNMTESGTFLARKSTWANVSSMLRDTHYLKVYVSDCKIRWESLSKKYRIERKNPSQSTWPHRFDMAILKSERNIFGRNPQGENSVPVQLNMKQVVKKPQRKRVVSGVLNNKKKATTSKEGKEWCRFDDAAVLKLIALRHKYQPKFISPLYRKKALWEEIAKEMKENGHMFSSKQCEDKMERLADEYKLCEERKDVTGNNVVDFAYEKEMRAFMGDWHNVHPVHLISFGCVSQNIKRRET